ncbi:MAG: alpha/beta hydrolase family esterase [Angustibacter sp.]
MSRPRRPWLAPLVLAFAGAAVLLVGGFRSDALPSPGDALRAVSGATERIAAPPPSVSPPGGGGSVPAPWGGPGATLTRERFDAGPHAGRTWSSFAPTTVRPGAPLVVVLHGGGGSGLDSATRNPLGRWQQVAAGRPGGMVVVYPDAAEDAQGQSQWNDCRAGDSATSGDRLPDDVSFLTALIQRMVARHQLSPDRVLVNGVSNGGMMTLRLAAERPSVVAGAGVVAASMPVDACGTPTRPVPLVLVHGTADPLVPYAGGAVRWGRGAVIGVDATLERWRAVNRSTVILPLAPLPDVDRADGPRGRSSTVWTSTDRHARGGDPTTFVQVRRGGHTVPDTSIVDPLPSRLVGSQNRDVDAVTVIWRALGGRW